MIKAKQERSGNIILGLSDINIQRLQAGDPIIFNMKDINDGDRLMIIFHGKTEEDMYVQSLDLIDLDKTKISFHSSLADKSKKK